MRVGKRDRGDPDRRRKGKSARPKPGRFLHHRLFGDIPLIRVKVEQADGSTWEGWDYDPDYSPPLPPGAVRGDVRKQAFCGHCHFPKYFYLDRAMVCVQCGKQFVFSAREQKYWYETLKFNFHSVAVRCLQCRRQRRTVSGLRNQIAEAKRRLEARPADPGLLLSLADATLRHRRLTGEGDLDAAIHACRKAFRVWPRAISALALEAGCHAVAGRRSKAAQLYRAFLEKNPRGRALQALSKEARQFLERASVGPSGKDPKPDP